MGEVSLMSLREANAEPQKSTKPRMGMREQHESEGGTENETHDEEEGMAEETKHHLTKHHKASAKHHRKMAKHHEALADEHHALSEHHEVMLGNLTEAPRKTSNY